MFFNTFLKQIMDQHASIKTVKAKQSPFINNCARLVNVKGHLRRKHNDMKTNSTWNKYRVQRNQVTKLKRESLKRYFEKKRGLKRIVISAIYSHVPNLFLKATKS